MSHAATATTPPGTIILLNGTSSSGKTSLARALQTLLHARGETYYHLEADLLRDMHPQRQRTKQVSMPTLLQAIPACVAALAAAGNNLLVDDVFHGEQLRNYVETLTLFSVLYVGVRCSRQDELLRREQARGDRDGAALGLARIVYQPGIFDVEVDSARSTPNESAETVCARLDAGPPFRAFHQLAQMNLASDRAGDNCL